MCELIETVTQDAQKQADNRLHRESSRIEQAKNREIAAASAESKKAVINARNLLLDKLFEQAADEIRKYTETDLYKNSLVKEIKDLSERFSHAQVYLMERDSFVSGQLPDNIECVYVKHDFIGGYKMHIAERNAVRDHTYLSRLKSIRADFNELKVTYADGAEAAK